MDRQESLGKLWDAHGTPVFLVMTDGVNMGNAKVRQSSTGDWLYVDDDDGYDILSAQDIKGWDLVPDDEDMPFYTAADCEKLLREAMRAIRAAYDNSLADDPDVWGEVDAVASRIERFLETGVKE